MICKIFKSNYPENDISQKIFMVKVITWQILKSTYQKIGYFHCMRNDNTN